MRIKTTFFAIAVAATAFTIPGNPIASADVCSDVYSIGVGGFAISARAGWEDSSYILNAEPVAYDSWNPLAGLYALGDAIQRHRDECPGDHIKLIGHSEGAALIHVWVTEHNGYGNVNAILLADPKRAAGPGWAGLSFAPGNGIIGYPMAGTDDWFGDIPVLTVCQHDDIVCNSEAGWFGYLFAGAHGRYNFDSDFYGTDWDGVAFL